METKVHLKKSNTSDVSLGVTGNSSISFEKKPTEFFTYSITGVAADPTSVEWRTNYAPRGYLWIPNVGFRCNEPLKQCDHMFFSRSGGNAGTLPPSADVTNLDMSAVITAVGMFRTCSFASNPSDLTGWDVSKVRDFQEMFRETDFNQDISGWTITTDASTPIDDLIPNWSTSKHPDVLIDGEDWSYWRFYSAQVRELAGASVAAHDGTGVNLFGMFEDNSSFNQPIGSWDVSAVFHMKDTFRGAVAFNADLSSWDVSNVKSMYALFYGTSYNQDITGWNVGNVRQMGWMLEDLTSFNQDISGWDVSNVILFRGTFHGATSFNQDISSWDTSSALTMDQMFEEASSFNQNIGAWDVSSCLDMEEMFQDATAFNNGGSGDIANWDVSSVTDMQEMFENSAFDQNIQAWDVSNISAEPYQFSNGTPTTWTTDEKPIWGTDGT